MTKRVFLLALFIRLKQGLIAFWRAIIDTVNHDGVEHAGYLAFLSLLSFFPFLVFFFSIVGAMGKSELGIQFITVVLYNNQLIPDRLVSALDPRINEIISGPPQGLITLSILGAIWTASSAVEGLRTTLNRAYRVSTPPAYIFRRLMSIVQFLVLTILLIVAMIVLVVLPILWDAIISHLPAQQLGKHVSLLYKLGLSKENVSQLATWNWTAVRYVFTVLILYFVVCSTYYIIPNIKQNWKAVVPGAVLVVIGWVVAGSLFSFYLSTFDQVNIIYGSLGGLIVSLLFFFIMSMILIFGAEFNYTINMLLGQKIQPRQLVRKRKLTTRR